MDYLKSVIAQEDIMKLIKNFAKVIINKKIIIKVLKFFLFFF